MIANELGYVQVAASLTTLRQSYLRLQAEISKPISEREKAWAYEELDDVILGINKSEIAMAMWDQDHNFDRVGTWIPLFSGYRIWLQDPRPQDIHLADIAHALSNICRCNGHSKKFYSVAQHSVLGTYLIDKKHAPAFLFHDGAEAYLGDIITPLKRILGPIYNPCEARMMTAISTKFHLPTDPETAAAVKVVDQVMLCTEVRDVTTCHVLKTVDRLALVPTDYSIKEFWSPERSEREFHQRFQELFSSRPMPEGV